MAAVRVWKTDLEPEAMEFKTLPRRWSANNTGTYTLPQRRRHTAEIATMVRDSYPELEFLVNTNTERRRSAKIPLDNRNSRILKQSINNYLGQSANIESEIESLERSVSDLNTYTTGVPSSLPVEDEQMHEVEKSMKQIGCIACRIRSLLKGIEPRTDFIANTEGSQSTLERNENTKNSSQYQTLAISTYTTLTTYKDVIDNYYSKLVSSSQHRPTSYWVVAEDEADLTHIHLLEEEVSKNAAKIKQRLSIQEHEITEREKRIREWHKLLSSTFQSKVQPDDECSSSSSPASYDIEAGLVKVRDYDITSCDDTTKLSHSLSIRKCGIACIVTIVSVVIVLGIVGALLYFYGGFKTYSNGIQGIVTPMYNATSSMLTQAQ
ncbi:hypothetical protein EB796_012560 [Bugula neritina]|uniref:Uncharacterized protein n=1 Tax=Bugula neritina TaxID=10212 RepID=A0A7J7JTZ2_BUGNE|nr:hypothetical protein EB796_012560 [Bugula neritina]